MHGACVGGLAAAAAEATGVPAVAPGPGASSLCAPASCNPFPTPYLPSHLGRYVVGDSRFQRYCKSNPRKMVKMWAEKVGKRVPSAAAAVRFWSCCMVATCTLARQHWVDSRSVAQPPHQCPHNCALPWPPHQSRRCATWRACTPPASCAPSRCSCACTCWVRRGGSGPRLAACCAAGPPGVPLMAALLPCCCKHLLPTGLAPWLSTIAPRPAMHASRSHGVHRRKWRGGAAAQGRRPAALAHAPGLH